jgi:anion-transporting  ArsA/GET3 family ATPase
MSLIITFLGKGGTGRTTMAIAAAQQLATAGKRVLLASQDPSPALGLRLGTSLTAEPQRIAGMHDGIQVVQLQTAVLLERSWEALKQLEAQYLQKPFFKAVYGQELGVLPGMDGALALNAIREYDISERYDVILYDGDGNQSTLRFLGAPEIASWYFRRFRQVFADSDLGRTLSPFIQPIASAVMSGNWTGGDIFSQPLAQEFTNLLEKGKGAIANPNRVMGYLVTTDDREAIATAKYLWGGAQQVGLTIGGLLVNRATVTEEMRSQFAAIPVTSVQMGEQLPDLMQAAQVPSPIEINVVERKVSLFLPGFDKTQVKLTQYGPEVTVEAADQRRNIFLPPELNGRQVTGAKFQDGYLIISF